MKPFPCIRSIKIIIHVFTLLRIFKGADFQNHIFIKLIFWEKLFQIVVMFSSIILLNKTVVDKNIVKLSFTLSNRITLFIVKSVAGIAIP